MHTGHSILVVDDEAAIRLLLQDLLAAEGHQVTCAVDGEDALERLRDGARPCLILLDLMMPRLDGWQLAERLRADPELREIPLVVTSAYPRYAAHTARLGARGWLGKPIDLDRLLATVEELCLAD